MGSLILISPHGFCAGVERAVQIAEAMRRKYPAPVYCLKQIVHNRQIIEELTLIKEDIHFSIPGELKG